MPTSFTETIYRNDRATVADLVVRLARMLSFTIHQREESLDSPLRPRKVPSRYRLNVLDAEDEVAKVQSMTDEDIIIQQNKEIALVKSANRTWAETHRSRRARYENAIAALNDWEPKTETGKIVQSKGIEHLRESMEFDASSNGPYRQPVPERLTADEYRQQLLKKVQKELDYSKRRLVEEEERTTRANEMLAELEQDIALLPDIRLDT